MGLQSPIPNLFNTSLIHALWSIVSATFSLFWLNTPTGFKVLIDGFVPALSYLLQTINTFLWLTNHIRLIFVNKTIRLLHLDFFIQFTIQKGSLGIHLVNLQIELIRDCKKKRNPVVIH